MPIATLTAMFVMFAGSFTGGTGAIAPLANSTVERSATAYGAVLQTETVSLDSISATLDQKSMARIIRAYYKETPVLAEIAFCESTFRHLDSKGNVIRGKVDPADVGIMQINERYHKDTATKLGLDLETIEGNMAYAKYLYDHQGTAPWSASEPCWGDRA